MHLIGFQVTPKYLQDTVASGPMGPPGPGPGSGGGEGGQEAREIHDFWNTFVYWELHYVMDLQAAELSVRDLARTLCCT